MALADREWMQVTIHHVVSEYLRSEREKFSNLPPPWLSVIDTPDLNSPLENHKRLRLLYVVRGNFMVEIPSDTTWWEVRLTENELDELLVSARHTPAWEVAGRRQAGRRDRARTAQITAV